MKEFPIPMWWPSPRRRIGFLSLQFLNRNQGPLPLQYEFESRLEF